MSLAWAPHALVLFSWRGPRVAQPLSRCPRMAGGEGDGRTRRRRPRAPSKGPSQFERSIDDLLGKRMGRGNIYYGERTGLMTDAELAAEAGDDGQGDFDEYLKVDPILVVGGTGRTGQWVSLGLVNQNFNVRVLTRVFERAETLFGPSGANVDIFQGDVCDPETLVDAVDGAVGVVIAAAPEWWRVGGSEKVEGSGAVSLIEAAVAAKTVRRIVLLSTTQDSSARASSKAAAEAALRKSGIPFFIVRIPSLSSDQGGLSNIVLRQGEAEVPVPGTSSLTRVDAAQIACQALVYDRFTQEMEDADPGAGFAFGNCVVEASNGNQPSIVDKRYWKTQFAKLVEEE